jgi:hypothetical protein
MYANYIRYQDSTAATDLCAVTSSSLWHSLRSQRPSQVAAQLILNHLLTSWSRDLRERIISPQIVGIFLAICGTRRFITSWARSIVSIPPSKFSKIHFIIILPSTPGPYKWSPSLRLPYQNPVCTSCLPHTCYMPCPFQSFWFDDPNGVFGEYRT